MRNRLVATSGITEAIGIPAHDAAAEGTEADPGVHGRAAMEPTALVYVGDNLGCGG